MTRMTSTHEEWFRLRQNETLELISKIGVSEAEYAALNLIHFGCHDTKDGLARFATSQDYSLGARLSVAETSAAVRSCFKRGFLRVVSDADLLEIRGELDRDHVTGPIYGLPELVKIDFTKAGAALWRAIQGAIPDDRPWPFQRGFANCDVVEIRTRRYFATRRAAERQRTLLHRMPDVASVTKVTPCPNLRLAWWCPPREGWQFDSTVQMKWMGRSGGGSRPTLEWNVKQAEIDSALVRRECRRHQTDLSDWCVLLTVASSEFLLAKSLRRSATEFAKRQFGLRNASERIADAISRCAKKQLIGRMGEGAIRRIGASIATSPRPMVLPELVPEHVDLSPAGIELLSHLGPKVFGDAWLDGWQVQQDVFRREHRYARNLLDVASVFEEYNHSEETVLAVGPITPLGPWCVYWWERHPTGYRVELEIGPAQPD